MIPGHGRVSEETDVAEFRDMVVIVRDRVQDLVAKKMTLEQIKAAKPSRDYDAEYGASPADADRFVESIYRSLTARSRREESRDWARARGPVLWPARRLVALIRRGALARKGLRAGAPAVRRRRRRPARASTSPATGCRSSAKTGAGG